MLKNVLLLSVLLCGVAFSTASWGQRLDHKQGEVIIRLDSDEDSRELERRYHHFQGVPTQLKIKQKLSRSLGIYRATFDHTRIHEYRFVERLHRDDLIAVAQLNHFLRRRMRAPQDPFLAEQWQWINLGNSGSADADIDADDAWGITTGGVTALGDTIVVASIDVGVFYEHPDLIDNIWMNRQEIPGNRIDDDENGYVDDVRGWNVLLENDNIEPELFAGGIEETHGTEILGVIGAVGDNGIGITGINWNVKMMNVFFNSDLNEADMIGAYGYILDQRKRYNESNGTHGAYVVATNLSYGDEELTIEETPIWCAIYDSLGAAGILNCIATSNNPINLDSVQDVPSSCTSEYMLAVTASNQSDQRTFSAFGVRDIDLAAPGDDVFTTGIPDYTYARGTSYASPIVAGAIGLLYASPCGDLAQLSKSDPAAAALRARNLILENVDPIEQLEVEVGSGGRLNIHRALVASIEACTSCTQAFGLQASTGRDTAQLLWETTDSVSVVDLRYRLSGDTSWILMEDVLSPLTLSELSTCTSYEYTLTTHCLDGTTTETNIQTFETTFCCEAPGQVTFIDQSSESVAVSWDTIMAASSYLVRWAAMADSLAWDSLIAPDPVIQLDNLTSCTEYFLQIQSNCIDGGVEIGDTIMFTTLGCGTCLDSTYCLPDIDPEGSEWINRIQLHTLDNTSGYDQGYGDYTGGVAPQLKQGSQYVLSIEPGFADTEMEEYYFAWIDFNQNGDFDNEQELIYASDSAQLGPVTTVVKIPDTVMLGLTRLRLLLIYEPLEDVVSACGTAVDLGEMEDYCVEIIFDSLLCQVPEGIDTMNFTGTSTDIVWEEVDSAIAYTLRYRKVGDEEWEEIADTANQYTLEELEDCSDYEVQVQAVCAFDTSGYSESFVFSTSCGTAADDELLAVSLKSFPNPFTHHLNIEISADRPTSAMLDIVYINGQHVWSKQTNIPSNQVNITIDDLGYLPTGIYLLRVQTALGTTVHKLMKH